MKIPTMAGEAAYAWRRKLWWATLGLIAIAAGMAIISILDGQGQSFEIIPIGILGVILAAFLFGASKLVDIGTTRNTGVFAMALLVAAGALFLTALATGTDYLGEIGGLLLATLIPAAAMVQAIRYPGGKIAGVVGLAILSIAFVVMAVGCFMEGSHNYQTSERVMGAGFCILLTAIGISICLAGAGTDRRHWRWLGVPLSVAAGVLGIIYQWVQPYQPNSDYYFCLGALITATSWGLAIANANLIWVWKLPAGYDRFRRIIVIVGFVTAAVCSWAPWDRDPVLMRIAAAMAVATATAAAVLGALSIFVRKSEPPRATLQFAAISLVCPHCQTSQSVPTGESACKNCGLKFQIDAREPVCAACGYVLLMNRSIRCPECGAPVIGTLPGAESPLPAVQT